jgi:isoleucyl-tRNA synthetase
MGGIDEVKRKFFGTLYNTYSFFSLYANVDGFKGDETAVPIKDRPEIDQWVMSLLNSLIKEVTSAYNSYEPTRAGRAIQDFVTENLSNWYVRLNRKRFWGGAFNQDKLAAYQTLHQCLETVALLAAPIAPFYMEKLFQDLHGNVSTQSVHLSLMPEWDEALINKELEERMTYAQQISSMVLALRRKVSIKVRQPLQKIMVPILDQAFETQLEAVKDLILGEVNVKELEYLKDSGGVLVKKIKPNFKALGPKYSKLMKQIAVGIGSMTSADISLFEQAGEFTIQVNGEEIMLVAEDVEIISEDIPGWLVANEGRITVALDITISDELREEGIARELVNRIQNLRKDSGLDVTDKIRLSIQKHAAINLAVEKHKGYIGSQTLATEVNLVEKCNDSASVSVELESDLETAIFIEKL